MRKARLDAEAVKDRAAALGIDFMSELARQADLHPSQLHRLLKGSGDGDGRNARPSHLLGLARALGCRPSDLIDTSDADLARVRDAQIEAETAEAAS